MTKPQDPYKLPVMPAASPIDEGCETPMTRFDPAELDEARHRLREHCGDSTALAADRKAVGGVLRPLTIVTLVFLVFLLLLGGGIDAGIARYDTMLAGLYVAATSLFLVFALVWLLVNDLCVGRRTAAKEPVVALNRWFLAAKAGKVGYLYAALAPTAREGTVEAPAYDREPPQCRFPIGDKDGLKKYLKSWARSDNKNMRWVECKKIELVEQQGDVARVRAQLEITAAPQWANILSVVVIVVFVLLHQVVFVLLCEVVWIVVWVVLYDALRKVRKLQSEKTLLRGDDGLWYVLDADFQH